MLSLPDRLYFRILERKIGLIVKPKRNSAICVPIVERQISSTPYKEILSVHMGSRGPTKGH